MFTFAFVNNKNKLNANAFIQSLTWRNIEKRTKNT